MHEGKGDSSQLPDHEFLVMSNRFAAEYYLNCFTRPIQGFQRHLKACGLICPVTSTPVVWEQDRHPNVRPINREKLTNEEVAELRSQALTKRNIAANDLYTHLKTCPTCKHFKK